MEHWQVVVSFNVPDGTVHRTKTCYFRLSIHFCPMELALTLLTREFKLSNIHFTTLAAIEKYARNTAVSSQPAIMAY